MRKEHSVSTSARWVFKRLVEVVTLEARFDIVYVDVTV